VKTENPCEKHNSNYFHVLLYLAQMLKSLKRLDVTGSKHLKQLPDLSSITSLEELLLEQCTRLEGIPECIGKRSTLKKLKLSYRGGRRSALRFFLRKSTRQQHIGLEFPDAKVKMDALINISIGGDITFEFCSKFRGYAEYVSFNSEQQIPIISAMSLQQALGSSQSATDSIPSAS